MPELPEARTIARRLDQQLVGLEIADVALCRCDMLKTGSCKALARLKGQSFNRADTRGKYVVLHALPGRLVVQLGMAGRIRLESADSPPEPHTHLRVRFVTGLEMRYANTRRIASGLHWLEAGGANASPLDRLGPEADRVDLASFVAALKGRHRPIKAALLDQHLLAGLGNIYSDEALARASIRPTRQAARVSRRELTRLHEAIRQVLAEAIQAGGSSLSGANPFVDADGELGYFAIHHAVYGRYGQPCRTCGATLRRTQIAGRTSTYCPHCQR